MPVKVYIVDDHSVFREGLKLLLSTIKGVELAGEAANGKLFLDNLSKPLPDIVFMDINMKEMDGIEATQKALQLHPQLKIVALTSFEDEEYFNKMNDMGVKGYLLKNSGKDDFERAIIRISEGFNYYSEELVIKLTQKMQQISKSKEVNLSFSPEEIQLLKCICEGLTNKQIASLMHLSARTIEAHRARLLEKTGTKNSVALAVYAVSRKLVALQ
jgi:DNA-binding NarL/FixJ family response regulator